MKITRFEDINAWQEARKLVKMVYSVINKSSKFRKDFRLVNQMQDAAVSSMSNTWPVKQRICFTSAYLSHQPIPGYTSAAQGDLKNRIKAHTSGKIESTKKRLPIDLIYYEACLNKGDAFHREKYLKTTYGRRYLKNRLKGYFTG